MTACVHRCIATVKVNLTLAATKALQADATKALQAEGCGDREIAVAIPIDITNATDAVAERVRGDWLIDRRPTAQGVEQPGVVIGGEDISFATQIAEARRADHQLFAAAGTTEVGRTAVDTGRPTMVTSADQHV